MKIGRRRYYYYAISNIIALLLLILAILIPILVWRKSDKLNEVKRYEAAEDAIYLWEQAVEQPCISAFSTAYQLAGFVLSNVTQIPDVDAPPQERIQNQTYPRFTLVAEMNNCLNAQLTLQALCPGGAVSNLYPEYEAHIGLDLFSVYPFAHEAMKHGRIGLEGPSPSLVSNMWVVTVLVPVFNVSLRKEQSKENFWGFVMNEIDFNMSIRESGILEAMNQVQATYILFTEQGNQFNVIVSSFNYSLDQKTIASFIDSADIVKSISSVFTLKIALNTAEVKKTLSASKLAMLFGIVPTVGVIVAGVAVGIITYCMPDYDGIEFAPKAPPFAMLIIGLRQGEELWNVAPDYMNDATEKLGKTLDKYMREYHAYQIPQLKPYTTTYILRSVDDAVLMAFRVIEELQSRPIDTDLISCLGDKGKIFVSYAAHWCERASVTLDPQTETLLYEGNELIMGSRMWETSAPNLVILSEEAKSMIMLHYLKVQYFQSFTFNMVENPMYFVFDPSRPLLQKAKAEAEKKLSDSHRRNPLEGRPALSNDESNSAVAASARGTSQSDAAYLHNSDIFEDMQKFRNNWGSMRTDRSIDLSVERGKTESEETEKNDSELNTEPKIPPSLAESLRLALEHQGVIQQISFDRAKIMMYYFYSCFKRMFQPLAAPQRHNIFMRLVTAFGVPKEGLLEHLAADCTMRYIKQQEEAAASLRPSFLLKARDEKRRGEES